MHIPPEILARIIEHVDKHPWSARLGHTLKLRLVSRTMNHEVLKVLLRSDELNPRNTEKLFELNRVRVSEHSIIQHAVRWRKKHAKSDDDTGFVPKRGHSCIMGSRINARTSLDRHEPRLLHAALLRPYLLARMERANESPCLLSALIYRSVDLIMSNVPRPSMKKRQQLFNSMVATFNTDLLGRPFADKVFSTLFDPHVLTDWLSFYESAHLTVYPNPEHSLRLFYVLRVIQTVIHVRPRIDPHWNRWEGGEDPWDPNEQIIALLSDLPQGPEYARLFVIDAFNIIANGKHTDEKKRFMTTFLASNAGKLLPTLTVAEQVWCAKKQGNFYLMLTLVGTELKRNGMKLGENRGGIDSVLHTANWIFKTLNELGVKTHFARTVVDDVLKCTDEKMIAQICRDVKDKEFSKWV